MIKWLSLFAMVAALAWTVADARNLGHGGRTGGNAGFSPDGSFIEGTGPSFTPVAGSAVSLRNSYGTWTLGPYRTDIIAHWCVPTDPIPNGCSDFYALYLNGHRVQGTETVERVLIDQGGIAFQMENDEIVWQWGDWQQLPNGGVYPTPSTAGFADTPQSPNYHPPYTSSPDGTTISGFTGTLTTDLGVWSWGNAQSGGYEVKLNGTYTDWNAPHLVATQLQVNSHGQLYIQHPDSTWRVYLDWAEATANAPTGQVIPLHADMVPTGPLAGHTAVSPACGDLIYRLPDAGSVGRLAGYMTVTMSDGSAFAGTVLVNPSDGVTLFNASVGGDGVITLTTKQNPVYGLAGGVATVVITVTQGGTSVSSKNFWFDTGSC